MLKSIIRSRWFYYLYWLIGLLVAVLVGSFVGLLVAVLFGWLVVGWLVC